MNKKEYDKLDKIANSITYEALSGKLDKVYFTICHFGEEWRGDHIIVYERKNEQK